MVEVALTTHLTIASIFFLYLASILLRYSGLISIAAKLKAEFFRPALWHSITVDVRIGTMSAIQTAERGQCLCWHDSLLVRRKTGSHLSKFARSGKEPITCLMRKGHSSRVRLTVHQTPLTVPCAVYHQALHFLEGHLVCPSTPLTYVFAFCIWQGCWWTGREINNFIY